MANNNSISSAVSLFRNGHYNDALFAFQKVLDRDPANPIALLYTNMTEEAIGSGLIPNGQIPNDARLALARARAYMTVGKHHIANDFLEIASRTVDETARGSGQWNILEWTKNEIEKTIDKENKWGEIERMINEGKFEDVVIFILEENQKQIGFDFIEVLRHLNFAIDTENTLYLSKNRVIQNYDENPKFLLKSQNIVIDLQQKWPNAKRFQDLSEVIQSHCDKCVDKIISNIKRVISEMTNAISINEQIEYLENSVKDLNTAQLLSPGRREVRYLQTSTLQKLEEVLFVQDELLKLTEILSQNTTMPLIIMARRILINFYEYSFDPEYKKIALVIQQNIAKKILKKINNGDLRGAKNLYELFETQVFHDFNHKGIHTEMKNKIDNLERKKNIIQIIKILCAILMVIGLIKFLVLIVQDAFS
jgi:tetratricopeptide (TPR) repeat protein